MHDISPPRRAMLLLLPLALIAASLTAPLAARAAPSSPVQVGAVTARKFAAPEARKLTPGLEPLHRTTGGSPWSWLGPNWIPGRMLCVTPQPYSPLTISVGSDGCGYWTGYSQSDGGWTPAANELGTGVAQIADRLLFTEETGLYEVVTVLGTNGVLYHSEDGATWTPSTLITDPQYNLGSPLKLLMDSGSSNVCYLLVPASDTNSEADGFIFMRSFDGGATFDGYEFIPGNAADMWASRTGPGELVLAYAQGSTVTVRSSDALGDPWTEQGTFEDPASEYVTSLTVTAQESATSGHVWIWENNTLHGSVDAGATWTAVRTMGPRSEGTRGLCASITNPDLLLWTTHDLVHLSRDGGVTDSTFANDWPSPGSVHARPLNIDCWTFFLATGATAPAARMRAAGQTGIAAPAGTDGVSLGYEQFYVSTGGGVYRWRADDAGAPALLTGYLCVSSEYSDTYTLPTSSSGYDLAGALRDNGSLGASADDPPPLNLYWSGGIISSGGNDVSQVVSNGLPAASPIQWSLFPDGLLLANGDGEFVGTGLPWSEHHHMLAEHPTLQNHVFYGMDELYDIELHKDTHSISATVVTTPYTGSNVEGFAIAPSNPDKWYLARYGPYFFTSDDAGATWDPRFSTNYSGPIDYFGQLRVKIVVNPLDADEAWVVGTDVVHTTDGGLTWSPEMDGLPFGASAGWDLAYDDNSPPTAYLASPAGPFRWTGASWFDLAPAGGDMPAVECRSVEYVPTLNTMRFGTWGRGIWDYDLSNTAAVTDGVRRLELAPSANPLRGAGELRFALPVAGHVKLELLDVAGRRVSTLLDEVRPAGRGAASVNGAQLGMGVYFARLTTAGGTRTSKVVVVR